MSEDITTVEGVQERNKKVKRKQLDLDAAIAAIMSQPQTRAWLYNLLTDCNMYRTSFDRSALSMSFNEGARNVGLVITANIMRVCPESYAQMLREAEVKND
jgi:hypothetical protein